LPDHADSREPGAAAAAPTALRVLTLNAHQGFGALRRRALLPAIKEALRSSDADLVFLQEVGGDAEADGRVAEEHYERLADQAWPQHAYGRNAVAGNGHQGNALLSRYPILHWRNVDVSVGRAEPRGLLHCVVDVPAARGPLHAVCVHLGLRESHRARQVDRLLALIAGQVPRDAPLVLAGDFNDWRGRVHRRLMSFPGMQEIGASALGAPLRSFPAWCPVLRLDRIYVRSLAHRLLPLPARPWSALSDHRPLAAEVEL
jgi:endonuclease/exonuclease/phosphatase family metal-dependent hydrolase